MIKKMKEEGLACSDEVRTVHLPAHKAHQITNFAVENEEVRECEEQSDELTRRIFWARCDDVDV